MSRYIIPECYGDTEFIRILGYKNANHSPSIGEVANRMKKSYVNKLAIGVIDKDKPGNVPSYFNDFEDHKITDHYEIKRLPNTEHYIIILIPALESFLLNVAAKLEVSPDKYGFNSLGRLKNFTKKQNISKDSNFKNFVSSLLQKNGSPLLEIKSFLESKIV